MSETSPANGGSYKAFGYRFDSETGLYRPDPAIGRFYNPLTGVWMGRDPIPFIAQEVNLYRYVGNDPTNAIDPSGLRAATIKSITVEAEPDEVWYADEKHLEAHWQMTFKGMDLKELEFTQFISSEVTLWDKDGKKLTKVQVIAAYAKSEISTKGAINPFANNVKDDGWGEGDNWDNFVKDKEQIETDSHTISVPYINKGADEYYAFQRTIKAVIKVRDKKTKRVVCEHKWSYTFQNYKMEKPKSPITAKNEDAGLYDYAGVKDVLFNKKPKKKK